MIDDLQHLSRERLIVKWKKLFKTDFPQHSKREYLIKRISWEIQAKKYGGYSLQTLKKLDKMSEKIMPSTDTQEKNVKIFKESTTLEIKAGTRLIREYKGEKHEVTALDKGFEYKDKLYKSLSAIANEITGTRWNGKIFFGIKK